MNTALVVDPRVPRRRLDVDDYHRMGEAGILTEAERVELIDGEIIEMAPIGDPHVDLVIELTARLGAAVGTRSVVSVQNPLRLSDDTEPQPDLAVLRLDRRRGVPLAADALLVVEVAESSLAYDRDTKVPRFARAGVVETWLVDVASRTLTRYRGPRADGYGERDVPDLSRAVPLAGLAGVEVELVGLL